MSPCRPTSRLIRMTRGLLILLSVLVIFCTIAFIHRMETAPKFNGNSNNLDVHSAQRALQQMDACRNCSQSAVEEEMVATKSVVTRATAASGAGTQEAAAAAAEILSPEEALPEEMIPDQESPAVHPQVSKPAAVTVPVETPAAVDTSLQQQEHAQQQESENPATVQQSPPKPAVVSDNVPAAAAGDNMSRTLLENKISAEPSRSRTVKVQGAEIESVRNAIRAYPQQQQQQQQQQQPVQPKSLSGDEENPPVVTRHLYQSGHILPPKDVCPDRGEGLKLMILITTAPGHAAQREAVRATWGHVAFRRDVGMAFMVGTSKNPLENQLIITENIIYGDIIQGRFIDTYNNLTLKTISMLEWSWEHCDRAKFLLKTDDDMYIHMPVLMSILDGAVNRRKTIIGKVAKRWKPIRNMTSKYYISPAQFKPAMYPDFNTGPAYIMTNDIVEPLYRASLDGIFFKLEDVYVTGMMAGPLKIQHVDFPQFFNRRLKLETCAVSKLASVHMVKTFEMFDLWKRLSDGLTRCPPK